MHPSFRLSGKARRTWAISLGWRLPDQYTARLQDSRSSRERANCRDARFCEAVLKGAQLDGAEFAGAELKGVMMDAHTSLDGVHWDYPKEFVEARFDDPASVFRALGGHAREVSDYRANERFYRLEMSALHLLAIGAV